MAAAAQDALFEENGLAILSGLLSASKSQAVLVAALELLADFAVASAPPESPAAAAAVGRPGGVLSGRVLEGRAAAGGSNIGLIARCGALIHKPLDISLHLSHPTPAICLNT
jgi:hypothetical protein